MKKMQHENGATRKIHREREREQNLEKSAK